MYRKILVPMDGSELSNCVLPHVQAIVEGGGVEEVIFLYAVEPLFAGSKRGDFDRQGGCGKRCAEHCGLFNSPGSGFNNHGHSREIWNHEVAHGKRS